MNMKTRFLTLILVGWGMMATAQNDEARLLRFPATNGSDVVFSYAGDLYTAPLSGGSAQRLTSHIGYEAFAKYSPDGKTIAFTGEYDGNREVYLIPAKGGTPQRLTFTSTNARDDMGDRMGPNNIVMGWTPDGKRIIYRNRTGDGFTGTLWTISPEGGMPEEIPLPEGGFCCYSPDGKSLAYNRVMREFRTWKYYRGGMADEVWIYDGKSVKQVTDNDAQDIFPLWVGDEIYFASDRDMTMNLFVYNTKTKATAKVTDFNDYDVKFPSTNGHLIVFEKGGFLYKLDPRTKQSEQIHITLASDEIYARSERRNVGDLIRSISLSPDGKRVAASARGEVFDIPIGEGITRNITRTPGSNDKNVDWSPDGKYIAFVGDQTGEAEFYLYSIETGTTEQITEDNDSYILHIQWSPDSKHILYTDRKNRIVELDPFSKQKTILMQNEAGAIWDVTYAHDSKWIAYSRTAPNNMNIVYVYNIETKKEYPVTEKWYNSNSPSFSSDGKYLIFSSDRDLSPNYSYVEWNYSYGDMSGVYLTLLAKETPSPFLPKDSESVNEKGKDNAYKKEGSETDKKKSDKKKITNVIIDPDGLAERTIKLSIQGGARNFFCDGKKLWFGTKGDTKVFDFETKKTEDYASGSIYYRNGDKKALLRSKGEYSVVDFPSPKIGKGDAIDRSNMFTTIDYAQEWPQIFNEVWRAFRDGYYLENMHGRDWKAVKEKYAALLPHVKTRLDLNYVIGEMIAEPASGHAYVNPGEYPKPARVKMGLLGAEISIDKSGYYRIDRIMQGAPYRKELRSPLTEPGMNILEGDYITAIDGIPTNTVSNLYELLIGKADVLTELIINSTASEGGRKVVVKPIEDEHPLTHYEWIQKNIKTVEEKSGGKVGYIYIPDMGVEGLNEFVRYYYPQLDKEALIIDDRANGGGNVSPMILERLLRAVYRMTMSRHSTMNGTIPEGTHTGPKVLLVNKYSASDGDLFPWSFKANKVGTVIGTRTWGGIVGISGSLPYMDGTDVRVPFFTNYDAKTGQWIVENHGVDPDIVLDNDPIKEQAGEDQQLEKAIQVALEQIKDRKPLPKTPAARTFKDLGLPEMK